MNAQAPLTAEQLRALYGLDACLVANAIETFGDQALIALCRSPKVSLEKLRALIASSTK